MGKMSILVGVMYQNIMIANKSYWNQVYNPWYVILNSRDLICRQFRILYAEINHCISNVLIIAITFRCHCSRILQFVSLIVILCLQYNFSNQALGVLFLQEGQEGVHHFCILYCLCHFSLFFILDADNCLFFIFEILAIFICILYSFCQLFCIL